MRKLIVSTIIIFLGLFFFFEEENSLASEKMTCDQVTYQIDVRDDKNPEFAHMDGDGNGFACEDKPLKPTSNPPIGSGATIPAGNSSVSVRETASFRNVETILTRVDTKWNADNTRSLLKRN